MAEGAPAASSGGKEPWGAWLVIAMLAALVVAASALTVTRSLDGLITQMQPPNGKSYPVSELLGAEQTQMRDGWATYVACLDGSNTQGVCTQQPGNSGESYTAPAELTKWYLRADIVLILSFVAFLIIAVVGLTRVVRRPLSGKWLSLVSIGLISAAGVAEIVENILLRSARSGSQIEPGAWLSGPKAGASALALASVASAGIVYLANRQPSQRRLRAYLLALRVPLIAAFVVLFLLLAGAGPIGEQGADAILAWGDDTLVWRGLIGLAMAALLGAILWQAARTFPTIGQGDPVEPRRKRFYLSALGLGIVLGVSFGWFQLEYDNAGGLVAVGTFVALYGVLGLLLRNADPTPAPAALAPAPRLGAALAAAPLICLGIAILAANLSQSPLPTADRHGFRPLFFLAGLAVVLGAALGILLGGRGSRLKEEFYVSGRRVWWISGALAVAVGFAFALAEIDLPRALGTTTVMLSFVAAVVIGLTLLALEMTRLPVHGLAAFRLHTIPLLSLLLIWAIVAASIDDETGYNDITRLGDDTTTPVTLAQAYDQWLTTAPSTKTSLEPPDRMEVRRAQPVIFLAASGGGIRAAYWTDLVMNCLYGNGSGAKDCATETQRERGRFLVFLASGASGGSLGLANYAGMAADEAKFPEGWVDSTLAHDFVAPTVARFLYPDSFWAFIRRSEGVNRSLLLEKQWQAASPDLKRGLYETWRDRGPMKPVPLLLLNGTIVDSGCRFGASVLNQYHDEPDSAEGTSPREDCGGLEQEGADPTLATTRMLSVECPNWDVSLATAALLSARFPFVSTSGQIDCDDDYKEGDDRTKKLRTLRVVDGGYYDSSAAGSVVEILDRLERKAFANEAQSNEKVCYVPLLVQIDNSPEGAQPPPSAGQSIESLSPLLTFGATRDAHIRNAHQQARLAFSGPLPGGWQLYSGGSTIAKPLDRYVRIYPRLQPGPRPPLGWTLSGAAQNTLKEQLGSNRIDFELAAKWSNENVECRRPATTNPTQEARAGSVSPAG